MSTVQALHNGIVFQFEELTKGFGKNNSFDETSKGGIYLGGNFDSTAKNPRWGIIVSVGPDVKDSSLVPGARIFIEALKWTNALTLDGVKYWKTDDDCVLLVEEVS